MQQLREALPFGSQPRYLIHDNDSIFRSAEVQRFLERTGVEPVRTSYHSPWQNGICERTIGTIRREVLDHIIPLDERHFQSLLDEYVDGYYNPARTHQGVGRTTPLASHTSPMSPASGEDLIARPVLGGLYSTYLKAA